MQLRQCLRSTGSSDVNEVTGPTGMGPSDLHGVKEEWKSGTSASRQPGTK